LTSPDDLPGGNPDRERYLLRLFVSGMTPRSTAAVARLKCICHQHLEGRCDLEVIDIYQQPALAGLEQIVATPTLVRERPLPARRLVGDMSDTPRVLAGLGLLTEETTS
jgi:circadian clock protein KaiB